MTCAVSGGPDSVALLALACAAGCDVDVVHVHHGLRAAADDDATIARSAAERFDAPFRLVRADVAPGPNLEARARLVRHEALGPHAATGHTADDQAETVLLALLRGSGARGLSAMKPGPTKPILSLRRAETHALCASLGVEVAHDHSNDDPSFRRNRLRHELLPLMSDIAERDVTPLIARAADVLRADDETLDAAAASLDPTDANALEVADPALAARSLREWLTTDGYPPDRATIERVMAVVRGEQPRTDVGQGRVVSRTHRRLRIIAADQGSARLTSNATEQ